MSCRDRTWTPLLVQGCGQKFCSCQDIECALQVTKWHAFNQLVMERIMSSLNRD